jgi:uncharacterized membrane protein HdeD (DUF308 family)
MNLRGRVVAPASCSGIDRSGAVVNETGPPAPTPSMHTRQSQRWHDRLDRFRDTVAAKTRYWWLLLIIGVAWIAIGVVILRVTFATVSTAAGYFGAFCVTMAAVEVIVGAATSRGSRVAHWLFAVLFVVVGVLAVAAVTATLIGLAAVIAVFFVLRGALDVVAAVAASRERGWWVLVIVGLAELGIGLWALSSPKLSLATLVVWVAVGTMIHGIGQIASAFLARRVGRDIARRRPH